MASAAKSGFRNSYYYKRYLSDPATYPLFVIIGGAAGLVAFAGLRTLRGHPDIYIDKTNRQSIIRDNHGEGEAHRDNVVRRFTKARAEDPYGLAIMPTLNRAVMGKHIAADKKKFSYDDDDDE